MRQRQDNAKPCRAEVKTGSYDSIPTRCHHKYYCLTMLFLRDTDKCEGNSKGLRRFEKLGRVEMEETLGVPKGGKTHFHKRENSYRRRVNHVVS